MKNVYRYSEAHKLYIIFLFLNYNKGAKQFLQWTIGKSKYTNLRFILHLVKFHVISLTTKKLLFHDTKSLKVMKKYFNEKFSCFLDYKKIIQLFFMQHHSSLDTLKVSIFSIKVFHLCLLHNRWAWLACRFIRPYYKYRPLILRGGSCHVLSLKYL